MYVTGQVSTTRMSHLFKVEKYIQKIDRGQLDVGEIKIIDGEFSWDDYKYKKML